MSDGRQKARRNPKTVNLIAGIAMLVVILGVAYVSYTSVNGLPWQKTYDISADLPNADRLVSKDDVRIGGVRVGRVAKVKVMEGADGETFARVDLELEKDVGRVPADTQVKVRPSSALGATYVDLTLGDSDETLAAGDILPLDNSVEVVELTDLLDIFDTATADAVQRSFAGLGAGFAGRGPALNIMLGSLGELMPPAERVARAVAAPSADLRGFLRGYESFIAALEPVDSEFAQLIGNASTTFAAFQHEREALADTIEALPATEQAVTAGFTRIQPALDGLARLTVDLRDGTELLPHTFRVVDETLDAGIPALGALPELTGPLQSTLAELERTGRSDSANGTLRKFSELFGHTSHLLETLTPAQVSCNVISLWGATFGNVFSAGGGGTQGLANVQLLSPGASGSIFQQARPAKDLGVNYLPIEDYRECESGNEPSPFGGPPRLEHHPETEPLTVPDVIPPAGVRDRAAKVGLLDDGKNP
jgi:phospholipid/cholesterol/gamma-HCH transport system substrate-binding protein